MNLKKTILLTFSIMSLASSSHALSFDSAGFGENLNGWQKNRTAYYSLNNHAYRTHVPSTTPRAGGGLFVTTRVDYGRKIKSYIELSFSAKGQLLSGQIRIAHGKDELKTALILREPARAVETQDGAPPIPSEEPWQNPTTRLIQELFQSLDTEFAKLEKSKSKKKQDLFTRLFGSGFNNANLSSALRHNVNLLIQHIN